MAIRSLLQQCTPEIVKVALRSSRGYRRCFGRRPNLFSPQTFTEWVQHRKVFDRDPRLPLRADKVLVKDFVASKIGAEHVIPTLWHGTQLPPREQRPWPRPFVLKANHASGWNHFVRSECEHDWDRIEQSADEWMASTYGVYDGEWLYSRIAPQLLVEPFIGRAGVLPIDYKFWVFRGQVRCVQVDFAREREHEHRRVMLDADWRQLSVRHGYPLAECPVDRPASLERMKAFAELLAEDFSFARVDFYEIAGRPLFGEMTFYPASGYKCFEPASFDRTCRDWLG